MLKLFKIFFLAFEEYLSNFFLFNFNILIISIFANFWINYKSTFIFNTYATSPTLVLITGMDILRASIIDSGRDS